jgi:hypothetical protein
MRGGEIPGSPGVRRYPGWFGNYWVIRKPGYGGCLVVMLTSWEEVEMARSCIRLWRDGRYDDGNE